MMELRSRIVGAWTAAAMVACTPPAGPAGGGPHSASSPERTGADAGSSEEGLSAVNAGAEPGVSCVRSVPNALANGALAASFLPTGATPGISGSTACGTVSASSGTLTLTKSGACAGQSNAVANYVALDPNRFVLCGDFDVQVDFDLAAFPVPSLNRWAGFRISVADPRCWAARVCPGLSLERYDNGSLTPTEYYKIWGTNPSLGASKLFATTDKTGQLRITRQGAVLKGYYRAAGSWKLVDQATASADPMVIQLYTGSCSAGSCKSVDQVDQSVLFTRLAISVGTAAGPSE
jgi:hypothetical protein